MSADGDIAARIYVTLIKRGVLTIREALNQLGHAKSHAESEDDACLIVEIIKRIEKVDPAVYGIEWGTKS